MPRWWRRKPRCKNRKQRVPTVSSRADCTVGNLQLELREDTWSSTIGMPCRVVQQKASSNLLPLNSTFDYGHGFHGEPTLHLNIPCQPRSLFQKPCPDTPSHAGLPIRKPSWPLMHSIDSIFEAHCPCKIPETQVGGLTSVPVCDWLGGSVRSYDPNDFGSLCTLPLLVFAGWASNFSPAFRALLLRG